MAATVYNGVLLGTGNHVVRTLYENTTGGNVRILWNWLKGGGSGADQDRKIFYGPSPTFSPSSYLNSGNLNHTGGDNLSVIDFEVRKDLATGKELARATQSDINFYKMTGTSGYFPLEIMLANTHKISLWTESGINTNDVAIAYNFVVIPE